MIIVCMLASFFIGGLIPATNILLLLLRAVVVLIVSSAVAYVMVYRTPEFKSLKTMVRGLIKR